MIRRNQNQTCPECKGSGSTEISSCCDAAIEFEACSECGEYADGVCQYCGGEGWVNIEIEDY